MDCKIELYVKKAGSDYKLEERKKMNRNSRVS
jgi:hypothetical protein